MTIPYSPLEPPLSWSHQQLTFPSQVTNQQIYLPLTKYHLKISPETEREIKTFVGKLNFIGSIAAASVCFQISKSVKKGLSHRIPTIFYLFISFPNVEV